MTWQELQLLNTQANNLSLPVNTLMGFSLETPISVAKILLKSRKPFSVKNDANNIEYITFTSHFIAQCIAVTNEGCINNMIPVEVALWYAYLNYKQEIIDTGSSSLENTELLIMTTLETRLIAELNDTYEDTEVLCPTENT